MTTMTMAAAPGADVLDELRLMSGWNWFDNHLGAASSNGGRPAVVASGLR